MIDIDAIIEQAKKKPKAKIWFDHLDEETQATLEYVRQKVKNTSGVNVRGLHRILDEKMPGVLPTRFVFSEWLKK